MDHKQDIDDDLHQLKYKFCETASFVVGKTNAKRSVSLLLFNGEKIKAAGNVTIPPNHEVPTTGQVVECRYLYGFRESGCIYQPVYLDVRDDITAEECNQCTMDAGANAPESDPRMVDLTHPWLRKKEERARDHG